MSLPNGMHSGVVLSDPHERLSAITREAGAYRGVNASIEANAVFWGDIFSPPRFATRLSDHVDVNLCRSCLRPSVPYRCMHVCAIAQ